MYLMTIYRVAHLLANLGWVDFYFGCSTLCLVLPGAPGLMGVRQDGEASQIKVNPTQATLY